MPVSTHKILFYETDIIKKLTLPIGKLSEKALEARKFREERSRNLNRKCTNEDILLISFDPIIRRLMKVTKKI